jgi:acyl phosphate:glycerol-3-phosphate acyltransferase
VTLLAAAVVAYLVGAIPVGFLVARAFGVIDIRTQGSGNIGTTNVLRTAGRLPGVMTLAGDVTKGFLAVVMGAAAGAASPLAFAVAAVSAVAGNCWSVFLRFRGGKGVATGFGALLALVPLATAPAALVWLTVALTLRYASLASLMAALCVPLGALILRYPADAVGASAVAAAIVFYRHRENITRLLAGTERRLGGDRGVA